MIMSVQINIIRLRKNVRPVNTKIGKSSRITKTDSTPLSPPPPNPSLTLNQLLIERGAN